MTFMFIQLEHKGYYREEGVNRAIGQLIVKQGLQEVGQQVVGGEC